MCRLASIAKLAGKQLEPHLAALIPKLYRYQHDPNPRVREAMTHIWQVRLLGLILTSYVSQKLRRPADAVNA